MPDIHIHREHHLGLKEARKVAFAWAEKAEKKLDLECVYEEGDTEDLLSFTRAGVKGTLVVDAQQFELRAQLGLLLGAFKDRIEAEIGEQLDALLNAPHPSAKKPAADRKKAATDTDAGKPAAKAAAKPVAKTRKH